MTFVDIFRLALRTFKHNRLRTFLTVLGIAVGIGSIVFLVALGYGLQKVTVEQITSSDALLALEVKPNDGDNPKELADDAIEKIDQLPQISHLEPVLSAVGQASLGESPGDVSIYGVGNKYFDLEGLGFKLGKALDSQSDNQIVVTTAVMELFSQSSDKLPDRKVSLNYFIENETSGTTDLVLDSTTYQIVGVVIDDVQSNVYIPYSQLKKYIPNQKIDSLKVQVKTQEQIAAVREKIASFGFSVTTVIDMVEQLESGFKIIRIILGLLGIIALVVASIGMFNTLTISLLERIKEVGIMKAIGAADKDIHRVFLAEAVLMGFFGGATGLLLGYLASALTNLIFNGLANAFEGQTVKLFHFPVWFILAILIFSCLVALITGIYPARRAGRLNPLQALRYE